MSDQSQGPGWWQASDGRWYPPEATPGPAAPPMPTSWGAPPPGYGYAYGPTGPAWGPPGPPSANGQAVASMVLGIVSLVLLCAWPISIVCALVGLPLGITVLRRINRGDVSADGKGMAVAGVVLCSIVLAVVVVIVALIVASSASDSTMGASGQWSS